MAETPSPASGRETLSRNWDELLQELRVMVTGVQILTGFLLTVPFSSRFGDLTSGQRNLYAAVLTGSVLTTALVVAPAAFHRMLFRQHARPWLVHAAHHCARIGLILLALTISGVLLLIFDVVFDPTAGSIAGVAALVFLTGLWAGLPLVLGRSAEEGDHVGWAHPGDE